MLAAVASAQNVECASSSWRRWSAQMLPQRHEPQLKQGCMFRQAKSYSHLASSHLTLH